MSFYTIILAKIFWLKSPQGATSRAKWNKHYVGTGPSLIFYLLIRKTRRQYSFKENIHKVIQSISAAEPKKCLSAPVPIPAPRSRNYFFRLRLLLQPRLRINVIKYLVTYLFLT